MKIKDTKILVVGGAGLIGSHVVDQLTKSGAKEIWIYDNFVRGSQENLAEAIKDPRVRIFEAGAISVSWIFWIGQLGGWTECFA